MASSPPSPFIAAIYDEFDRDRDGVLDPKETKALLEAFTGHRVNETECGQFLASIDEDDDALIQPDELERFVGKGRHLTEAQRAAYSARGHLHQTILEFFQECDRRRGEGEA